MLNKFLRIYLLVMITAVATMLVGCKTSTGDDVDEPVEPPANRAPTISGDPADFIESEDFYSFVPVAADADGDTLTFSIVDQPEWSEFNESTGELSGTPSNTHIGQYTDIRISVSDGQVVASLPAFSIEVRSGDEEPPPPPPPPASGDYVGYGSMTKGADSCPTTPTTYRVTSVSGGSGAGTFRDAVSEDCRHIVFDVAGDIDLGSLQISNSYLTIDGSTAPTPGITLVNVGRLALEASGDRDVRDIIINNIRAIGRGGSTESADLWELDGSSGAPVYNIVLDHLTMQEAGDGNVDIYGDVWNVTLSNSLITDSIQGHHFSRSSGLRERISIYGNVYARLNERQPRIRYNTRNLDYVGNVIFGWGWFEGGAAGMHIDVGSGSPSANVENNVYIYVPGLNGDSDDGLRIDDLQGSWFFANNNWPSGESTGDTATTSGRVSTVYQGVDYLLPRQRADVAAAGTHFKTAGEVALLQQINTAISAL